MLTAHQVIQGYMQGIFPMAEPEEGNEIYWYEPTLRGIILPNEFKISKNLRREYQKNKFEILWIDYYERTTFSFYSFSSFKRKEICFDYDRENVYHS